MIDPTIICPSCKTEIKLTESLAAPLLEPTRLKYEQQIAEKEGAVAKREATIKAEQAALAKARETVDEQVAEKLKSQRATIAAEEAKKARTLLAGDLDLKVKELSELQEVLKQREEKLAEAQKAQADLIRKQRELDDAKRELELTVETRVQESLAATREEAKKEAEEGLKFKVLEKEETIRAMQKQIEELKRKAEQGSQQLQGEVQELELEAVLRERFPRDSIEAVPKGEHGGDVLQRVFGPSEQPCGTILWESKRTKNWSDSWLAKLREDQRQANAEFAVIVSQVLPKGVAIFDFVDGIWVTSPPTLVPVGIALRHSLLELALARQAAEGQQTKMDLIYQYMTGPRFRRRVEAIVEKFSDMQADLEKERKTMTKLWARRQEQIRCVIESTAGMYGDLQGIAGKTLQEIEGLEMGLLEVADAKSDADESASRAPQGAG
ncbi:MAG: DUF2130 domain-containing protein [Gemmataceae bacterium]|nr:DUF2130 domain-containing protein [Gemmataceae bacterium]